MANGTKLIPDEYELIDSGISDRLDSSPDFEIIDPGTEPAVEAAAQPQRAPGGWYDPVVEPMQAAGAAVAGTVVGGWRGLVELASGGSLEDYGQTVVETQKAFNEWGAPETERGAQAMQTVGELMEKGVDLARMPLSLVAGTATLLSTADPEKANQIVEAVQTEGLGNVAGDAVFEKTGSPLLAAAVSVSPEIVGTVAGGRAALSRTPREPIKQTPVRAAGRAILDPVGATRRGIEARRQRHADIAQSIREGRGDERIVGYVLDGQGRIELDTTLRDLGDEAHRQGFDRGFLASAQGASPQDKAAIKEMLAIKRRADDDKRYRQLHRPGDVLGRVLTGHIRHIRSKNREAGRQLDGVAKDLKGEFVDFREPVQSFIDELEAAGVGFDANFNPRFKASDFRGSPAAKRLIKEMINFMKDPGRGLFPDAYDLHRMKRFIDETVAYGKNAKGLAGKAEVIVKDLRHSVDELLDNNFPDYDRVNTQYADTISVLNSVQDLAGRKTDLSGTYADAALGKLMRRVSSNYGSRERVLESLDDIERIFTKYDGVIEHDPVTLLITANELDDVFGPAADTGFVAGIREGTKKGVAEYAAGRGAIHTMVDVGREATEGLRGINRDNAYNIMERFLDYGE